MTFHLKKAKTFRSTQYIKITSIYGTQFNSRQVGLFSSP
jgi:hypothetical protein